MAANEKDQQPKKPIAAKNLAFTSPSGDDITVPADSGMIRFDDKYLLISEKKINLKLGMKSLATKLGLIENPIRITGLKLPDDFYRMIDPSTIETSMVQVYGNITKEMLKRHVKEAMTKSCNARATKTVMEKGACEAVKEGHYPIEKLPLVKQGENMLREIAEDKRRLELDVPYGKTVHFTVPKTGKEIEIISRRDYGDDAEKIEKPSDNNAEGVDLDTTRVFFVKRKHYFFYSNQSGYGKSTVLSKLKKRCNCASIKDFNNWKGVSEVAQFLTKDEFSHTSDITVDDLKELAGGVNDSFKGNMKSYGEGYTPRGDVQLVMASNYHLFQCVGSKYDSATKTRTMHHQTAKQLFDRFHIIKFDDETVGELEQGAACLATDDARYEEFFDEDEEREELDELVCGEHEELVRRFVKLIKNRVYHAKRKRPRDDDEFEEDDYDDENYLGISPFDSRRRPLNKCLYRRFLNNLARLSW